MNLIGMESGVTKHGNDWTALQEADGTLHISVARDDVVIFEMVTPDQVQSKEGLVEYIHTMEHDLYPKGITDGTDN